jgi:hypothetical protein
MKSPVPEKGAQAVFPYREHITLGDSLMQEERLEEQIEESSTTGEWETQSFVIGGGGISAQNVSIRTVI